MVSSSHGILDNCVRQSFLLANLWNFDMLFYANFLPFQKWQFNFETSIALRISHGILNVTYQNPS